MKRIAFFSIVLALCFFSVSCSKNKDNVLYVYNWSYYTPEEVVEAFEEKYDCKVIMDYYASNEEMFAKLMVAPSSGYDIVIPSADYVSIMIKLDMISKLDKSKIPNLKYLTDIVKEKADYDPEQDYSVPYFMGSMGIAVNKTKLTDYEKDWSIFSRQDLKGKMCMMDDMREVLGVALLTLGYSCNTHSEEELEEAYELVENSWKPNLTKFDAEGFAKSFSTGEYIVAQGYAESFFEEIPESRWDEVDFFIPEKCTLYIDSMVVPKGARHYDLALKFIDFMLEPENYAKFLDRFGFPSSTNTEADNYRTTTPHYSTEDLKNGELKEDLGEYLDLYNKVWEKIRYTN